jgi:hypothetical protein
MKEVEHLMLASNIKIPEVAILPVEGCQDLVYTREDMTSIIAWVRLALDNDMTLQRWDFVNEDDYWRYFFVVSGLMDYACAIINGPEGEGKSLGQSVLTYQILRLFPEKRGTLDWSPPKRCAYLTDIGRSIHSDHPNYELIQAIEKSDREFVPLDILAKDFEISLLDMQRLGRQLQNEGLIKIDTVPEFKRCDRLLDDEVVKKLVDEVNKTSEYKEDIPDEVLNSLIVYNRVFGLDECDRWGDKGYRTNLTKLIGRIINRRRHYHTSFFMVYIDPNRVDKGYIWDRRTHVITATKVGYDECDYRIFHKRAGKTYHMTLHPSKWWRLWDTHNISAVSHGVTVDLGSKNVNKHKKEEQKDGLR